LLGGLATVGIVTVILAVPLGLFVSWPVSLFAVTGALAVGVAARMSRTAVAILGSVVATIAIVAMGTDSYVQYGTTQFWAAPALIHNCGMTVKPYGLATGLGNGDGPAYQHVGTTPAGDFVYGISGCGGGGLYFVGAGGKLIVYRVSP